MLSMSGGRLAQSMSALPSAASTVGRMLHRHQTMTPQLAPPTSSSSPSTEDENGFVMLQPDKPASTTAVARYDFDGFGGQLSFRRGDEIVLLNYPPLATSSSSRQTPYASSSSTSTSSSWCVGKRAMDGVTGIVYLPALKLPSSTPASPTSALASPTGPRRGRLFIIDHSSTKAREDEERVDKEHRGYDQYGNAVEDEPPATTKRKENYGAQAVGFVLVLLVLLFVLGCLGQAGWGLAVLGFLPRLASLLDRLVQRRFL